MMQLSCFCLPQVNLGTRLYKWFICKCSSEPLADESGEVTVNVLGSVVFPLYALILQTISLCICEPKFNFFLNLWNHWNLLQEKKKERFVKIYAHKKQLHTLL